MKTKEELQKDATRLMAAHNVSRIHATQDGNYFMQHADAINQNNDLKKSDETWLGSVITFISADEVPEMVTTKPEGNDGNPGNPDGDISNPEPTHNENLNGTLVPKADVVDGPYLNGTLQYGSVGGVPAIPGAELDKLEDGKENTGNKGLGA